MSEKMDRFGVVASSLCATHCALSALLPVAFSALGLGFLVGHEAEWVFTLVAIALGLGALILGWRQHHSPQIIGVLALGIVGLLASRGLEMGSEHHGHHEDSHQAQAEQTEAHSAGVKTAGHEDGGEGKEKHHEGESAHEGSMHLVGAVVGILAGLLLMLGHILNMRAIRQCQKACCP